MELPLKSLLNSDYRFFGMELERTKIFLVLSHHFTAMSTVALLVAIEAMLLPCMLQKILNFSCQWCKFHFRTMFTFC
jgi:hypothetical protein